MHVIKHAVCGEVQVEQVGVRVKPSDARSIGPGVVIGLVRSVDL